MTKTNRHIYLLTAFVVMLLSAFVMSSCSTEENSDDGTVIKDKPIMFAAQAAKQIETRAAGEEVDDEENEEPKEEGRYVDSGPIKHGEFCLTYVHQSWNNSNTSVSGYSDAVADVNFDKSVLEGTGVGIVTTQTDWKEVAWRDVYTKSDSFYMDNVLKKYNTKYDASTHKNEHQWKDIILTGDCPFKAGIFDYKDGTNDLLWGMNKVARETNPIVMDLHHNMAIVRVEIRVDQSHELYEEIDLTNAEVSISSLVHKPYSFNRKNGILSLGSNPKRESLTMVNPLDEEELGWVSEPKTEVVAGDNGENKTYRVYTTKDFVLPPQGLPEDENRSRLTIKVKDENGNVTKTYSGILPYAMWENPGISDETPNGTPMNLYFLKEHKLTIRTVISQDPPELVFMPVLVIDWVDKGTYILDGHQSGIYKAEDFYSMIKYYQKNNETKLSNYGYLSNKTWVFNIFASINLDFDRIANSMVNTGQKPFMFDKNRRYNVYVTMSSNGDGEREVVSVSADQLYEIVTQGTFTPEPDSPEDTEP